MAEHDNGAGAQWEASSESNFRAGPSLFCSDDKLPDSKAEPTTLRSNRES